MLWGIRFLLLYPYRHYDIILFYINLIAQNPLRCVGQVVISDSQVIAT